MPGTPPPPPYIRYRSGTELVRAAVQQGETLNCVVMTMRL